MKTVNELSSKTKRDEALNEVSGRISRFKGDLETAAHDAGVNIKTFYNEKRSELNELLDDVTATVRRKPLQTSLAAVAVGFIIGKILSR